VLLGRLTFLPVLRDNAPNPDGGISLVLPDWFELFHSIPHGQSLSAKLLPTMKDLNLCG
jgi:hypothetical protein